MVTGVDRTTGPGYECSGDADCLENAICRFMDEETECECTGGYERNGTSCQSKCGLTL